ncbi:hypothetical protein [Streptomyces boninensis]|uniref:hypothetical protein n=1 Tax=Streptomyces boninensis TaxID=2039455 RepID=UPI003B218519
MSTHSAAEEARLAFWQRVRQYAVPPAMIETATARRLLGDWGGACAAAGFDVDLQLRSAGRLYGRDVAARIRADLRRLAPDLLRWHLPRIAPDGLLRPGLTVTLARYGAEGGGGAAVVHLVARTPPAWADGGQRICLGLWDPGRPDAAPYAHPHPRPERRFRLDLHRHLWDAERAAELGSRAGTGSAAAQLRDRLPDITPPGTGSAVEHWAVEAGIVPPGPGLAVDRWAAEAGILLGAEGRDEGGAVLVRLAARRRLELHVSPGPTGWRITSLVAASRAGGARVDAARADPIRTAGSRAAAHPVLPEAAVRVPPDVELLRAGLIEADRLHPLVAAALVPGRQPGPPRASTDGGPRVLDCRGARHRIGLVDGVLSPLDHEPAELRREELLAALGGTPLPCLRIIDEAHRRPECMTGVRERLVHGDAAGALAVVEGLLGPEARLRPGALQDELRAAAERRIAYGLFRAGLHSAARGPLRTDRRSGHHRTRPRQALAR